MSNAVAGNADSTGTLLCQFEETLGGDVGSGKTLSSAKEKLRAALATGSSVADAKNLDDAISSAAASRKPQSPVIATALIRSLDVPGLIRDSGAGGALPRLIVDIVERSLPELSAQLELSTKRQTFEKYETLRAVHARAREALEPFSAIQPDLDSLISSRKMLTRALSDDLIRVYCAPLKLAEVRAGFETIYNKLIKLAKEPASLASEISECRDAIRSQLLYCSSNINFLTKQYYTRFLQISEEALDKFFLSVRGKFRAPISPRLLTGDMLQKRYPLREVGRSISLTIPLRNSGPGVAANLLVKIEADPEKILFASEELSLGSVPAGDFSAVFDAEVTEASERLDVLVSLSWDEAGEADRQKADFVVAVYAQRHGVDWQQYEYERPYSTEVAKGDKFVGRSEKVQALANKILRTPMESFYVTGQKRVGKTSLALAAVEFARSRSSSHDLRSKYLLWGNIANADPRASLRELGEQVADFITASFPPNTKIPNVSFDGSIAAIVRLAELAAEVCPSTKYAIIIDEFDEIHPELYQHGNLAETFFANIRAITTCENICLALVGGENMPFVMDRQGQKLNKLVRVPLDYFSRDREWEDFKLLVRRPAADVLEWHDEAISAIFNVTNGNPFFTKIACAAVFEDCVRERDADVTAQEVQSAIAAQVPSFDTNAFAHLWQDGIHKPVSEREPDVLRRCRTLVLVARTSRRGLPITLENLASHKQSVLLADNDILIVLNDFVRRGVLRENGGQYDFVLPIFKLWLAEVGGSRLIADALGEELALQVQTAEDQAYVRSDEVTALARKWPTYRGQAVTSDDIRAWYEQVDGHQNQRLLFKILTATRVLNEGEVRERLRTLHGLIRPQLPEYIQRKRSDRRQDVFITYVDGEGKSGQYYASRYAEENRISIGSIIPPSSFSEEVLSRLKENIRPAIIVIIDDLIGTGRSLSNNLDQFVRLNEAVLKSLDVPLVALALSSTSEGDRRVRDSMQHFDWLNFDLRFCDVLGPKEEAFPQNDRGFWDSNDEKERAKALCQDLGASIYRDNPLGYGSRGLLVVFPNNCPNNTLPILHSPSRLDASQSWRPLFPRAVR